jgi:hypothetical protein
VTVTRQPEKPDRFRRKRMNGAAMGMQYGKKSLLVSSAPAVHPGSGKKGNPVHETCVRSAD